MKVYLDGELVDTIRSRRRNRRRRSRKLLKWPEPGSRSKEHRKTTEEIVKYITTKVKMHKKIPKAAKATKPAVSSIFAAAKLKVDSKIKTEDKIEASGRHLAGQYTWKVTFTVLDADADDMQDFEEALEDDSFVAAVNDELEIVVEVEEVSGSISYASTSDKDDDDDGDGIVPGVDAASGYIIVAAAAVVFAFVGVGSFCYLQGKKSENSNNISPVTEMAPVPAAPLEGRSKPMPVAEVPSQVEDEAPGKRVAAL